MAYVIAATPRVGSFLLCGGLRSTGTAGRPDEYGRREDTATWRKAYRCRSHAEYFFRFPSLCCGGNGVIGTKLMWPQYRALARDGRHYLRAKGSDAEVVRTLIGPFQVVRLSRRNRLRQAISLVRAEATGVWSLSGAARPRSDGPEPEYDSAAIARALSEIDRQERAWRAELDEIGAPVLEILYEDLLASYEGSVKQTLEFLGLPYAGPLPPPQLRPQADPITEEWVERARRELGTR